MWRSNLNVRRHMDIIIVHNNNTVQNGGKKAREVRNFVKNNINTISTIIEVHGTMDFFQHRYYRTNKMLLELLGIWPYQSLRVRVFSFVVIHFFAVSLIVPQVISIVKRLDDWDFIMKCTIPLITESVFIAREFTFVFNSHKILKLLNRIHSDWEDLSQDCDVNILHEYAEEGRKLSNLLTVVMITTCTIFLTQPVLPKIIDVLLKNGSEPGQIPLPLDYYYIDMQEYYFYVIIHIYVCVFGIFMMGSAYDALVMVYVQHGCGLFAILRHKLERLQQNQLLAQSGKVAYGLDKSDIAVDYLAWCIDKHNHSIEYAELLGATYSWYFFIMGSLNMFLISVVGIQIFENSNEPEVLSKFVFSIISAMGHVYFENYMGQILLDHSISIRSYILQGKWYMLPLKAQKLLPMMIMRCNVPCKLTAAKLTFLSMETFVVILKTSLSYFTLFRSVQ